MRHWRLLLPLVALACAPKPVVTAPQGPPPPAAAAATSSPTSEPPRSTLPLGPVPETATEPDPNARRRFSDLRSDRLGDSPAPYDDAPPGTSPPFDRRAAAAALGAVDLSACVTDGGILGSGHLRITFATDGSVSRAWIDVPPFEATATGACVASKFTPVRVPPFGGAAVTVGKSFTLR